MKRVFLGGLASLLIAMTHGSAEAREWTIVGPRALGMGGANVAVANDASASYWNPAAFGLFNHTEGGEYGKRKWSAVVDAGFEEQVHEDLGEVLNEITKIDFNTVNSGTISANNVTNFLDLVNNLKTFNDDPSRALTMTMNGGLRTQVSHYGVAGYVFSDISAKGDLDLVNISPVATGGTGAFTLADFTNPANYGCPGCSTTIVPTTSLTLAQRDALNTYLTATLGWTATQSAGFINAVDNGLTSSGQPVPADIVTKVENVASVGNAAAGAGGTMANNTSSLLFKGIAVGEVPVTYGYTITDDLAVGANIKYMKARVYNTSVPVFNTQFSDALSTAKNDYTDSQNFGVDIGVLYRFGDNLRVGLVGRNLNSPEFDMKPLLPGEKGKISEKAQVRAGVAYKPINFVTLALDCDLTKNDTTASSVYKSQNLGGGFEVNLLKILQVRAGAYQNLAKHDIGPVFTGGLGLNLWAVNVDLGASAAPKTTTVDGQDIPKEIRAELAISTLF